MNIQLLVIDPQNDFCDPNGSLFVPGADEDIKRSRGWQQASLDQPDRCDVGLGTSFELPSDVVGRITENDLSEAEKSFPGIIAIYEGLETKPLTFLQLVYLYEVAVVG